MGYREKVINVSNMRKSANKEIATDNDVNLHITMATYGYETWLLSNSHIKRIGAFEIKCYGTILRIPR